MNPDEEKTGIDWDHFKQNPNQYQSISVGDFVMNQKNFENAVRFHEERIGRYPLGYRHYENYANYQHEVKGSTIEDYVEAMNRECEFSEFLSIHRQHMLEVSSLPDYQHEHVTLLLKRYGYIPNRDSEGNKLEEARLGDINMKEIGEGGSHVNALDAMAEFINTPEFVEETKKLYAQRLSENLAVKK